MGTARGRKGQARTGARPTRRVSRNNSMLRRRKNSSMLKRLSNKPGNNRNARSSRRSRGSTKKVGRRRAAGRLMPRSSKIGPKTGLPTIAPGMLRRLLHPARPLQRLFRQPALLPYWHDAEHVYGVSKVLLRRFSYGGCSFLMVDPWPGDWPENWYSNDDVYIDYDYDDGGYYLYNRSYPQYRFAVTVVFRFRDPLTAVSQDTGSCTQLVNTFSP